MTETSVLFRQGSAQAQQAATGQASPEQRDPSVVGGWRHTEIHASDGISFVSDTFLDIYPDGRYVMSSGGSGFSTPDASIISDGGNIIEQGFWRTNGNRIETQDGPWPTMGWWLDLLRRRCKSDAHHLVRQSHPVRTLPLIR